jgi:hypothetical protein
MISVTMWRPGATAEVAARRAAPPQRTSRLTDAQRSSPAFERDLTRPSAPIPAARAATPANPDFVGRGAAGLVGGHTETEPPICRAGTVLPSVPVAH